MGLSIDWGPMAQIDLQGIGDRAVMAELMNIATTELDEDFLPVTTDDQGTVRARPQPGVAWRRGLRRDTAWALAASEAPEDPSSNRACDYVLAYRPPDKTEIVNAASADGRKLDFVVIRVLPAREYVQHIDHQIVEKALQLGDLWSQFLQTLDERLL